MQKAVLLLCLIFCVSCSKIEPENSNVEYRIAQSRKSDTVQLFNDEDYTLTNPLLVTAFGTSAQTLLDEFSDAKDQLAIDSNSITSKKDVYVAVYTMAAIAIETNPSIEFMTTSEEKETAVSAIIFPSNTNVGITPKQACFLSAVVGFLGTQTMDIKEIISIVKLMVSSTQQLNDATLTEIIKFILNGTVSNLTWEISRAISITNLNSCLATADVLITDDLTTKTVQQIQSDNNFSLAELSGMVQTFYNSEPTIERMKFYLLSNMNNIIESQVYDSGTNSYITERSYNPEYYSIKSSTDYTFLASKITTSISKVQAYLSQGNIIPYELDEESL